MKQRALFRLNVILLSAFIILNMIFLSILPFWGQETNYNDSSSSTDTVTKVIPNISPIKVSDLDQLLILPRLDETVSDLHSQEAVKLYKQGDFNASLQEACQSFNTNKKVFAPETPGSLDWAIYISLTACDDDISKSLRQQMGNFEWISYIIDNNLYFGYLANDDLAEFIQTTIAVRTSEDQRASWAWNNPVFGNYSLVYDSMKNDVEVEKKINNLAVIYFQRYVYSTTHKSDNTWGLDGDSSLWLLRRVIEFSPNYHLARLNYASLWGLGTIGCNRDIYYNPKDEYRLVIERDPSNITARYYLGLNSQNNDAEKIFHDLIKEFPNFPFGYMGLADLHLSQGTEWLENRPFQAKEALNYAINEYDQAIFIQPDAYELLAAKAEAQSYLKNYPEAIQLQTQALLRNPGYDAWQRELIKYHEGMNDYSTAARINLLMLEQKSFSEKNSSWGLYKPESHFSYASDRRIRFTWNPNVGQMCGGGGFFTNSSREIIPRYHAQDQYDVTGRLFLLLRDYFLAGEYSNVVVTYSNWDLNKYLSEFEEYWARPVEEAGLKQLVASAYYMLDKPNQAFLVMSEIKKNEDIKNTDEIRYQVFRYTANLLRQAGRNKDAISVYQNWYDLSFEKFTCIVEMAETYFWLGDYLQAEKYFLQAIDMKPTDTNINMALGLVYEKSGQENNAIYQYNQALRLNGEQQLIAKSESWSIPYNLIETERVLHTRLGDIFFEQKQDLDAANEYLQVMPGPIWQFDMQTKLDESKYSQVLSNLGLIYLRNNQFGLAQKIFKKAIEMDAANPIFFLNLGWAYDLAGNPERASEAYIQSLQLDPSLFPARNDLGVIYAEEGKIDNAIQEFQQAIKYNSDYDLAFYNMGVVLLRHRPFQWISAQTYLSNAFKMNPLLKGADFKFMKDNRVYQIELNKLAISFSDWSFAREYRRSIIGLTWGALVVLIVLLLRNSVFSYLQDTLFERYIVRFWENRTLSPQVRIIKRNIKRINDIWTIFSQKIARHIPNNTLFANWFIFIISMMIITFIVYWPIAFEAQMGYLSMLFMIGYSVFLALAIHQLGHYIAHLHLSSWPQTWVWLHGSVISLVVVLLTNYIFAPPIAIRPSRQHKNPELFYFLGPVLNIIFCVIFYAMFLYSNFLMFRIASIVNLILANSSLISVSPMDGYLLGKKYDIALLNAGLLLGTVIAAIGLGII